MLKLLFFFAMQLNLNEVDDDLERIKIYTLPPCCMTPNYVYSARSSVGLLEIGAAVGRWLCHGHDHENTNVQYCRYSNSLVPSRNTRFVSDIA